MALLREVKGPVQAAVFGSITDGNEGLRQHAQAPASRCGWWNAPPSAVRNGSTPASSPASAATPTCWCRPGRGRITLVAGDGDYEPMVQQLVQDGFEVTLLYEAHASRALQAVVYPLGADLEGLALR